MPLEKQSLNNFLPDGFETNNLEGYKENFSADKIATGYEKDVKDRVSGPNFNNLLDVLGKNTNVLTNFMDFIKNMPINNIFVVDENNQLAYKPIDEGGGGGLEIGDIGIAPLGIDETKGKRRYLNGQIIIQEQYAGFTKKVKDAINLYPSLACSEDEWQTTALLTVGGQVGKFVVDDDAGTIRLPKIIMPIQGLTDLSKLAEIVKAGLPNIKAYYCSLGSGEGLDSVSGAFKGTNNFQWPYGHLGGGQPLSGLNVNFNASNSNPIYKDGSTVQQEQIQYPYFIQVATGAETKDEITNEHELVNPYVLLEPKFFETPVYNLSWLISNGSFTGSKAVHPHAYDALLIELNADIEVGTTKNNYTKRGLPVKLATDSYTDYDFVVNPADETFRPPLKVNLASGKAVLGNGNAMRFTDGTYTGTLALNRYTNNTSYGFMANTDYPELTKVGAAIGDTFVAASKNKAGGLITSGDSGIETSDSNLYLYFYVGEVAQNTNLVNAGRIEEIKANKTDIDGNWIYKGNKAILTEVIVSATFNQTYDLSSILPDDGNVYDVEFWGYGYTEAKAASICSIILNGGYSNAQLCKVDNLDRATTFDWASSVRVLVDTNRQIRVSSDGAVNTATLWLQVTNYRKVR